MGNPIRVDRHGGKKDLAFGLTARRVLHPVDSLAARLISRLLSAPSALDPDFFYAPSLPYLGGLRVDSHFFLYPGSQFEKILELSCLKQRTYKYHLTNSTDML